MMRLHSLAFAAVFAISACAFADVTITSPSNGQTVSSPFNLAASAPSCSSQPVRSIGYSIDNSHDTTVIRGTTLDVRVASSVGKHKIHVKAWAFDGSVCGAAVSISVSTTANTAVAVPAMQIASAPVPADAIAATHLERLDGWFAAHDRTSDGNSSGEMNMVASPSRTGSARQFVTTYSDSGDERYSVFFGKESDSTHFLYDGWVYLDDSASRIANLELDVNQTMPNGDTVIFGIQCDGYANRWDYSENLGTPDHPRGNWTRSNVACNPRKWSRNQWHHVQLSYSRDDDGKITYGSIYFDGVESQINATVLGSRTLGWRPNLSTNFQIDGLGSNGTITAYLDDLTIYRW